MEYLEVKENNALVLSEEAREKVDELLRHRWGVDPFEVKEQVIEGAECVVLYYPELRVTIWVYPEYLEIFEDLPGQEPQPILRVYQ